MARALLLEARLQAARVLLGDDASLAPRDLFEEMGGRLFGAAIDARLRGAWPAQRDDEPSRFVALVEAHALASDLRDRFDADWYRNPQRVEPHHLQLAAASPAEAPVEPEPIAAKVDALARALEGAVA